MSTCGREYQHDPQDVPAVRSVRSVRFTPENLRSDLHLEVVAWRITAKAYIGYRCVLVQTVVGRDCRSILQWTVGGSQDRAWAT